MAKHSESKMAQSLARVWLHVVFSTKDRRAFLQHEKFRDEMLKMLHYQIDQTGCLAVRTGGWIDHVHFVCGLSRTITISSLVEHVKTETTRWAKSVDFGSSAFAWQAGYRAFSVSQSLLERVVEYVNSQAEHHSTKTYQDEF